MNPHRSIKLTTIVIRHASLVLALLVVAAQPACTSSDNLVPEPVVHTPLALDPTDDIVIQPWWIGKDRLVHLRSNGVYTVHPRANQYTPPLERGRWDRTAYLVIRLAPYEPASAMPSELRLQVHEGDLCAQRPGEELLRASANPPIASEDELIGRWQSEFANLDIRSDLTFEMSLRRDLSPDARPRAFMREHGTWSFVDGVLVLKRITPDEHARVIPVHDLASKEGVDETANEGGSVQPWMRIDGQRFDHLADRTVLAPSTG